VGRKSKMSKTLLGFIVFSVLAIGFLSYANAEEDPRFIGVEPECREFTGTQITPLGNKTTIMLDCKWVIESIEGPKVGVVQPDLTPEEVKVIKDAMKCRTDPTCKPPVIAEPPENPDTNDDGKIDREEMIEQNKKRACERAEKTDDTKDDDLCSSWIEASFCEQGIDESEPVQTHRFFLTTDFVLSAWRHHDYDNDYQLKILTAANLECKYQRTILEPIILGPQYLGFTRQSEDIQPYHADQVELTPWRDYRVEHHRLTPSVFANANDQAYSALCNSDHISKATKADYKCLKQEPKDRDWERDVKNTSGVIPVKSKALDNYLDYKQNPKVAVPIGATGKFIIIDNFESSTDDTKWTFKVEQD
jgi:hypothetical protein